MTEPDNCSEKKMKPSKFLVFVAVFGAVLVSASSVYAALAAVGPTSVRTGFPRWYMDGNGLKLGPCKNAVVCPVDPTGVESFYYLARAIVRGAAGAPSANVTFAVEATYLNGAVVPGEQITFSRARYKITNLPGPGVYTVQHPWGSRSFSVNAPDAKGVFKINSTKDVGIALGIFTGALGGKVGPFVSQIGAPPGFMGNVNVDAPINPGPSGLDRLIVSGPTGEIINQPLWSVGGQIKPF